MEMMSPERQLVTPFFTGGETISVSYPVASMSFEQKMMTMRGNNIPFSRATVFHELIPGHELQLYMAARYRTYRGGHQRHAVSGPEGWALYWELLLWDMKFQQDAGGSRRRSLLAHAPLRAHHLLAQLSSRQDDSRRNASTFWSTASVTSARTRPAKCVASFGGVYRPLYQAAYLLGGIAALRAA